MSTIGADAPVRASDDDVVRAVAWNVLVGASAGAIAGFVVGGIGGRLAMLLLRLTSPESVIGITSDDGFEIGVFSPATFNLLLTATGLGAIVGVLYAAVRGAVPARLRVGLWTVFWALFGGAAVVNEDGVDFTALEPVWLAIALFVLLPGVVAAATALLAERWSRATPWQSRRQTVLMLLAALASTIALVVAVVVGAVMLAVTVALRRLGPAGDKVRRAALVVVPLALAGVAVVAAVDLVGKSLRLLD